MLFGNGVTYKLCGKKSAIWYEYYNFLDTDGFMAFSFKGKNNTGQSLGYKIAVFAGNLSRDKPYPLRKEIGQADFNESNEQFAIRLTSPGFGLQTKRLLDHYLPNQK